MKRISTFLALAISPGAALYATEAKLSTSRCVIDFPFDSAVPNKAQVEACITEVRTLAQVPEQVVVFTTSSSSGDSDYNYNLSKRRAQAVQDIIAKEYPGLKVELFHGGENPEFGQKAVVLAAVGREPILPAVKEAPAPEKPRWTQRMEIVAGPHTLRDNRAHYSGLGVGFAVRPTLTPVNLEAGFQVISMSAEDHYDQYSLVLDVGPVFSFGSLDLMPKVLYRGLYNEEGSRSGDVGVRAAALYHFGRNNVGLSVSTSQETQDLLLSTGINL
ncbi:MAG TPA: hypothetical protein VE954_32190 [Oligoflexus sp.]|uniref:hypothetical protein n=1 Tax=Oligoflexus sp. TaxID=1971216 RepID=UPI002D5213BE|nr:hypothetical protein [Oligoflexus sp.]HYX37787.1 hypothetical protein [Oligoflexus sp.]